MLAAMNRTVTVAAIVPLLLSSLAISCGGKAPPAAGGPVANTGGETDTVPAGIHACQFVLEGNAYGPHRCDVAAGTPIKIDKVSGMEPFSGTITKAAAGLELTAAIGCGDMSVACHQAFTVVLIKDGDTWRGPVVASGGEPGWWLAGATFELVDSAGYGGATYGDAWPVPED